MERREQTANGNQDAATQDNLTVIPDHLAWAYPEFTPISDDEEEDGTCALDDEEDKQSPRFHRVFINRLRRPAGHRERAPEHLKRVLLSDIRPDVKHRYSLHSALIDREEFRPLLRSGSHEIQNEREHMEDRHIAVDDLHGHVGFRCYGAPEPVAVYAIFDGHGGAGVAEFLKDNLVDDLFLDPAFPSDVAGALKSVLAKLDGAVRDKEIRGGACALVAVVVGPKLYAANVGDCRAVMVRGGSSLQLTRDHKAEGEVQRIEQAGGHVDPYGYIGGVLQVGRTVGDWLFRGGHVDVAGLISEPEVTEYDLGYKDEFLIMGSDGLFDSMSCMYAREVARRTFLRGGSPEECAKALVERAKQWRSEDNITCIVVCFQRYNLPPLQKERRIELEAVPRSRRTREDSSHESLFDFA